MGNEEELKARIVELESRLAVYETDDKEQVRSEKTRMTVSKGKEIGSDEGHLGGEFEFKENPEFIEKRLSIYAELKSKKDAENQLQPREPIKVVLPDGKEIEGLSWETSPMDVAMGISVGLASNVVVAKVFYSRRVGSTVAVADSSGFDEGEGSAIDKGELWDLTRPLEGDCKLELLKFDDRDAKMVFWHSSAHILGECIECQLGSHLTVGPPVEPGFYYDTYLGANGVDEACKSKLEAAAKKVVKDKQPFERIVLTKEEALLLFQDNPYKLSIIRNKVKDGSLTSAYRCGPLIDLCMGPHIPDTGRVKAFEISRATTAYWLGSADNDSLQRVYGISFPDKKLLKEHKAFLLKAAENDHRRKGEDQKLFFFHPFSPGCAFFLPHGQRIYNALTDFIKGEYHKRGYDEVNTPNIFNVELWKISQHWKHYQEDMFSFKDADKGLYGLKPMNCPGHCLMFRHATRSYRELPMRYADFGVLHRNESSGSLSGLIRVRKFCQDDAHIFCRESQVYDEIMAALEFMKHVYALFGMTFKLERSTRPKKACGLVNDDGSPNVAGIAMWDNAEATLKRALDDFVGAGNWKDNPGDGAFYGPKIDIKVFDCMKRIHQCATVQLDFQQPVNFGLVYSTETNEAGVPIIIHRAMLGSLERMIAILTEHFGGKWPFWLSPRQAIVIPVHADQKEFAESVRTRLHSAGIYCDVENSNKTLNKKILNAQHEQYNFMLVVGNEEMGTDSVNIRSRANRRMGVMTVDETIALFSQFKNERIMDTEPPEQEFTKPEK